MPITCPNCGEKNSDDMRMCNKCGVLLPKTAPLYAPITPQLIPASTTMPPPPPMVATARIPLQEATNLEYARFGQRFAAVFIDGLIMTVAGGIVGGVIGFILGSAGYQVKVIQIIAQITGAIINWLYFALMESSSSQATLGKMALGIKVTTLDGERIGFGRATGRVFSKYLSAIILLIGYFMAAFTQKKQALHDIIAGTLVVQK